MPLATMPWWKSLGVMNENKGVFGLNMLHWWDREGNLDRVDRAAHRRARGGRARSPVVAEAFPFDRAADAHRFIEERRNVGKVVLLAAVRHLDARPIASIGSLYDRAIVDTGRQPEFLFFVSFLITFGFIRTSAHMIRAQVSWWPGNVRSAAPTSTTWCGGSCDHDHRLRRGRDRARTRPGTRSSPSLFGIGTGLALDEFALWLDLKDVYWSEQGRRSIDAVIVAATFAGIVLVGFTAWARRRHEVEDVVFAWSAPSGSSRSCSRSSTSRRRSSSLAVVGLFFPPVGAGRRRSGSASRTPCGPHASTATRRRRAPMREAVRARPGARSAAQPARVSRPPARAEGDRAVGRASASPRARAARRSLVDQHADRGGDRDREQGSQDAQELGADQDRDDRDRRVHLDRVLVQQRLDDPVLELLVDEEEHRPR